jgi:hypothetical protein
MGIHLVFAPVESLSSLGLEERIHGPIRRIYNKILLERAQLGPQPKNSRPTHDNPAEVETIYFFVRPYPADRAPMNKYSTLDEDTPTTLTFGEAADEEILASGGPSNTKPQPRLSSGLACPARIPRSAPHPAPGMSAYDAMDADPKSATATPRGSSAELPPSLVTRMQAAGHLSLLEYYARAYHQND